MTTKNTTTQHTDIVRQFGLMLLAAKDLAAFHANSTARDRANFNNEAKALTGTEMEQNRK